MKPDIAATIGAIFITGLIALPIYAYRQGPPIEHKVLAKQPSSMNGKMLFDNSEPGLWEFSNQMSSPTDKRINSQHSAQQCITAEDVQRMQQTSLEQKLNTEGLQCEGGMTRINQFLGNFSLNCRGHDPVKQQEVSLAIEGSINSHPHTNEVHVNYVFKSERSPALESSMTIRAQRIGQCPEGK